MRDAIVQVLIENGLEAPGSLHGWRCEHPSVYGPCTCLDELADDLVSAVSQQFPAPEATEGEDA